MKKLGVVLFGASRYDSWPGLNKPQFAESARQFGKLISSQAVVGEREIRVLDLYDRPDSAGQITSQITGFLKSNQFDDVVLYYCGHGDFSSDRAYSLCLRTTTEAALATSSLKVKDLGDDLRAFVAETRVYFVLDACYAGHAAKQFMDVSLAPLVEQQLAESFPQRGVAVIAATEGRDVALAPTDHKYTLFTGALIKTLESEIAGTQQLLSWRDVFEHTRAAIKRGSQGPAPRPTLTPVRQPDGDITTVPFFVNPSFGRAARPETSKATHGAKNALDTAVFRDNPDTLHCLVVMAEPASAKFVGHVRLALEAYSAEIEQVTAAFPRLGSGASIVQSALDVAAAFATADTLKAAVIALCRADIVVFDITNMQPGVMLLLGVRSVARRGVTVCSYGDTYIHGQGLPLPFNLQLLNVGAHSDGQSKIRNAQPMHIIGRKIVTGLKEFATMPTYMDLPAYDHVRNSGFGAHNLKPIPRSDRVLVLCPFAEAYEERNWNQVLQPELAGKLKKSRPSGAKGGDQSAGPMLVRLLDVETPRLVVQTLYDLIRRVDMCIVDWTNLRPNVMYELGVRLAANRLGAVHIVDRAKHADAGSKSDDGKSSSLAQVERMKALFHLFAYDCDDPKPEQFMAMVDWFDRGSRGASNPDDVAALQRERQLDYLVYETIGQCEALRDCDDPPSTFDELVNQARQYSGEDEESIGTSRILYHDVDRKLRARGAVAAVERRIAAWLLLDARYTDAELEGNPEAARRLRALSSQIRLWFGKEQAAGADASLDHYRERILARIDQRVLPLGEATPTLSEIVNDVVTLKNEAKILRDARDLAGAIQRLRQAIELIDGSGWEQSIDTPTEAQTNVAYQFADCLGMLGGNYRRNGELNLAIANFERGAQYERDKRYRISSSYNAVNAVVSRIESGQATKSQANALRQAIILLERQIFDPASAEQSRRNDRWAWTDLGQCKLLLGDLEGARAAYRRFIELGDTTSTQSSLGPLRSLFATLKARQDPTADIVRAGIDILEAAQTPQTSNQPA